MPVHAFLLRHVYASTITTYRLSKFQAAFFTFLLSALIHELVMAVVTKKIRFYLFAMQVSVETHSHRKGRRILTASILFPSLQMCQLPLIMVGRAAFFKRHAALGNVSQALRVPEVRQLTRLSLLLFSSSSGLVYWQDFPSWECATFDSSFKISLQTPHATLPSLVNLLARSFRFRSE